MAQATHLDAEEIATLVNRGTDSLKNGDLASARLLLRRAAESGSANAALMLGETYDPLSIQQLGAIGVVPDVEQARQWYEKAAALGSVAASQQLVKLAHSVTEQRPREDLCLENRCCAGSDTQASSSPAPLAKKSNDDQPPFQPSY